MGYASSAVSAMTLVGTIGMLGFGTMLIAEAGRDKDRAGGLITASLLSSAAVGGLGAIAFVSVAEMAGSPLAYATGAAPALLMLCGAALTSLCFVLDQAVIGLMAGGIQLFRNVVFSLAKLGAVVVTATLIAPRYGTGALFAWVLGTAISLALVLPVARRTEIPLWGRPDWRTLHSLRWVTASHTVLNLATQAPRLALPVLVTAVVSPRAGGFFYVSWMVAQLVYLIPGHLATVLFAIGAGQVDVLREKLRFTLKTSLLVGVVATGTVAVTAHMVLTLFGRSYAAGGSRILLILLLGYIPMAVKTHYVAVVRVQRRLSTGASIAAVGAVAEITVAAVAGTTSGLTGLCAALLVVFVVEAGVMGPTVLRAATAHAAQMDAERAP